MYILHNVTHNVEGVETSIYVVYDAPPESDIAQLIHDAALDYYFATQKSGNVVTGMSYADFALNVPNEYCERRGFRKILLSNIAKPFDGKSPCLPKQEIHRLLEDRQKAEYQNIAMHKAFSAFGRRMEPAMRKSTAMADWTFHQVTKQMLAWAEEYAGMGLNPYGHFERSFVDSKLSLVRQSETMEPPAEDSTE